MDTPGRRGVDAHVKWPLLAALALVAVALIWRERARRAQLMALGVAAVAVGYAWINLGKV